VVNALNSAGRKMGWAGRRTVQVRVTKTITKKKKNLALLTRRKAPKRKKQKSRN